MLPRPSSLLRPARRGPCAFTLAELLVALGITSLTIALVLPFFLFNLRSIFHGEQKLLINGDIRTLTNAMMENARAANYFALYQGFYAFDYTRDLNGDGARDTLDVALGGGVSVSRDADGNGVLNALDRRMAGSTGDFLVLVFTRNNAVFDSRFYDGDPTNNPANTNDVVRLVAYWIAPHRDAPRTGEARDRMALYSFDTDRFRASPTASTWTTPWGRQFPATLGPTTTLESLLPPATAAAAIDTRYAEILVHNIDGISANGNCFINFANRSVVVQARVLHGNRAKRVTNTYNFAITPRG